MVDNAEKISLVEIIIKLFQNLSSRRKRQLILLSVLIIVSSISEILTLSSIQPLLVALAQSDKSNILIKSNETFFSKIFINNEQSLISLLFIFIILLIISASLRLLNIY